MVIMMHGMMNGTMHGMMNGSMHGMGWENLLSPYCLQYWFLRY